jgi:ubiquinone/menaquinone biosynthesis C-methylase UbiE
MTDNKHTHEQVANFYNDEYYSNTNAITTSTHLRKLAKKIAPQRDDCLLDIACGTGAWLSAISPCSDNAVGMDISEKAIRVCRKTLAHDRFCIGLGEKLPFRNDIFDLITCLGSLEHFLDQPLALREIRRVAKPSAKILILVPNSGFLTYRLGIFKGTNQIGIHETIRSIDDWIQMFTDAGLTVTDQWSDLHVLSREWISKRGVLHIPVRALQAFMLLLWPLQWQYQVYFECRVNGQV